jgi:hypothetical protein
MSTLSPQSIFLFHERLMRPFVHMFRRDNALTGNYPWSAVTHTVGSVMEVSLEQQITTATNTKKVMVFDAAPQR